MIKVGDRVAYSRAFLRNTGQFTGNIPFLRGTVKSEQIEKEFHLLTVQWDGWKETKVLASNLILESRLHLEPV